MFPSLVYKCPGPHECSGGTYDHLSIGDAQALDVALASGWYTTLPDAISPPAIAPPDDEPLPDDNAPPTRVEMEAKAAELGLKFDGRTGNTKLGKMIAEALRGLD